MLQLRTGFCAPSRPASTITAVCKLQMAEFLKDQSEVNRATARLGQRLGGFIRQDVASEDTANIMQVPSPVMTADCVSSMPCHRLLVICPLPGTCTSYRQGPSQDKRLCMVHPSTSTGHPCAPSATPDSRPAHRHSRASTPSC